MIQRFPDEVSEEERQAFLRRMERDPAFAALAMQQSEALLAELRDRPSDELRNLLGRGGRDLFLHARQACRTFHDMSGSSRVTAGMCEREARLVKGTLGDKDGAKVLGIVENAYVKRFRELLEEPDRREVA